MNYQKIDASLAMALDSVPADEASLVVFIHTQAAPDAEGRAFLENLGVSNITSSNDVFTATLSPNAIAQLSEQPWVQYLKLSQQLRLLNQR